MHSTSSILYKKIYNAQFAYIIPILFIGFRIEGLAGIAGLLSLLLIFSYMSYHVLVLLRNLPGKMPLFPFLAGTFFTVGGSIIDMVSTVMCSPDLSREANYMVLMLLDSHVSLSLIYLFMFCFQILMSIMIVGLWGCFLKTYPTMLYRIPYKNYGTTLTWFMGIGNNSLLEWISLKKVDPYFSLSSTTIILLVMQLFHWHASLEWWDLIPISIELRIVSLGGALCLTILVLVAWTHFKLKPNIKIN